MANYEPGNGTTAMGVTFGTGLCILHNVFSGDVLKTSLLAALGAIVSYATSLFLKWLWKQLQ